MKYTPLHVHTHYSLLDGLTKLDDYIAKAKDCGMDAIAITDHGTMYGVIEFYQKCKAEGIKPIIGVEAYVVDEHKKKNASEEERYHLILLAKNYQGYKNLIKLITKAHLDGFYYKPRIDHDLLREHSEGLICSSACLQGEVARAILKNSSDEEVKKVIEKYRSIFGEDFYLEVQHHPNLPNQKIVNDKLFQLGKEMKIDIIATTDTHYLNSEDADAHDILICLQTKHTVSDKNRMSYLGEDFSLMTPEQMSDFFRANPEVLENTNKIAEKCDLEIPLGEIQLPHYELPEGHDDYSWLRKMCYDSIKRRYDFDPASSELNEEQKTVIERLEYELGIIKKTGFSSYFLIVQDFINWAKENSVVVGPGRGSAAGSIVAYLTNITNLDPIHYDLLFERFLNPARISMPDIDTDFADDKRDLVLKYVEEKYGSDHVAQIITFGTMAARASVKDVGRVLEMPYTFCDKVSKLIPMNMKLEQAVTQVSELKELYNSDKDAKRLIDYAKKIEGVSRHSSTHACGVVITQKPLEEYCPVQHARDQEDAIVTQYSLHPVEDLGLLKMDFLGLKNLTIMDRACEIIEAIHGKKIIIDDITLDNDAAYALFREGKTTGVFQFESSGMKKYLRQLQPGNIEDLIAMVSLYRPGPMELIPDYIARKFGRQEVSYLHPLLEKSLKKTYGIAIYQEQIMQMARDLAGFSLGEADVLRKAVGKKKVKLLAEQKKKFIEGCVTNDIPKNKAEEIFSFIEPFAGYGFNRSHAACYAFIAYQTAYLKANYPAEFMASLMTADQNNLDRVAIEIDECNRMGIRVLAPNVNESFSSFSVVAETLQTTEPHIRFGLTAVRNVGDAVAKAIVHERKENGLYQNLEDFLTRLGGQFLNKKVLEGLIKSGSLDAFGARDELWHNMDKLLLFIKESEINKNSMQKDLFSSQNGGESYAVKLILEKDHPSEDKSEILSWEKEFLGLYVSEHPFNKYEQLFKDLISPISAVNKYYGGDKLIRSAGVITTLKKIVTRKGDPMMFLGLDDGHGNLEVLIFPKLYQAITVDLAEGDILLVEGAVSMKDDERKILANKVWRVDAGNLQTLINHCKSTFVAPLKMESEEEEIEGAETERNRLIIKYPSGASKEFAKQVKELFTAAAGDRQVFLKVGEKLIKTNFMVSENSLNKVKMTELLGEDAIVKN